jgi:predicted dehydrogenase
MPKTITIGLLTQDGGAHLDSYFKALASCPEVEAVAIADPSGKTFDRARKDLEGKFKETFKNPTELLRVVKPQAVLVSMEAVATPPVIAAALDAGCHVLSEKPACVKVEDFARLVRKAQEKHRQLMLTLANRSHPATREARRLVKEGKIGKVYGIELHLIADQTRLRAPDYKDRWVAQKARAGGGCLSWLGIHWLDLGSYLTGLKVKQVAGFTGNVGGQPLDTEDTAVLALRYESGATGTMTSGYYLDKGYHSHIQVWGSDGWLRLPMVEEQPLEWYSNKDDKQPRVQRFEYGKGERGYSAFIHEGIHACVTGEAPPITGEECLQVLRVVFALYEASRTGRVQDVD